MIISIGSLWSLRQSSFYKPSFLVNDIKEKQFDYIILGASTGLTTLNTKTIDSVLQTNGLNLAMDDTALSSQYLMLQHFLAQGKSAKFCILAPSATSFEVDNNEISGNDYRFLPFINSDYVSDYYKAFSKQPAPLLHWSKWVPMLGVSYFNAELFYPSLLTVVTPKKRNRFDDKGNYNYPINNSIDKPIVNTKMLPIDFKNPYANKIKALCELHNIKLICYFSPMQTKKVVTETTGFTIINHSNLLKNEMFFFDEKHVNNNGRYISSIQFANTFKSNYISSLDE